MEEATTTTTTSNSDLMNALAAFTSDVIRLDTMTNLDARWQERRGKLVIQCVTQLDQYHNELTSSNAEQDMIDLSRIRDMKTMLEFIVCWHVYPLMSMGVGQSLKYRLNSNIATKVEQAKDFVKAAINDDTINDEYSLFILRRLVNWSLDSNGSSLARLLRSKFLMDIYTGLIDEVYGPYCDLDIKREYELLLRQLFVSIEPMDNFEVLLPLVRSGEPRWFTRVVSRYLSIVVTSKEGVRHLLAYIFSKDQIEEETEEVSLDVIDGIFRLLMALPDKPNGREQTYIQVVTSQLINILAVPLELWPTSSVDQGQVTLNPIQRGAASVLVRLMDIWSGDDWYRLATTALAPIQSTVDSDTWSTTEIEVNEDKSVQAVYLLYQLLINGEPAAERYQRLLAPCLPKLFILWCLASQHDLYMKTLLDDLFTTYFRIIDDNDALLQLRQLIFEVDYTRMQYIVGPKGNPVLLDIKKETSLPQQRKKPLIQVVDSDDEHDDDQDRPVNGHDVDEFFNEEWIANLIELLDNEAISGGLVALLLQEYQNTMSLSASEQSATRMVRAVNLLLLLLDRFGTTIVKQPYQIVKLAIQILDHDEIDTKKAQPAKEPSSILFMVDESKIRQSEQEEEDEEESLALDSITLTLLNTIVTEHHGLPTSCQTLRLPLMAVLTRLQQHPSQFMAELAKSIHDQLMPQQQDDDDDTSNNGTSNNTTRRVNQSREQYEAALRSLQDKVLPVRAYGMVTLRNMILARDPLFDDPTLLENTLHLFISMIQDDDSFIYLNAIKGLSSLTDIHGAHVIRLLMAVYLDTRAQLDHRLRIGEVLLQTIKRCGTALGIHADTLIHPLMYVLHQETTRTEIRHSALSIIGVMCETYPLAFLAHLDELIDWAMNALKLEPALELRRAAAGLFIFLFRGLGTHMVGQISTNQIQSITATLRLAEQTDPDDLTRYQARTAILTLQQVFAPQSSTSS